MKKKTKQKIIDSAIDLFSKDSYGKVSIAQICKNAKISNGIIYNYFRNKEELFTYLLEETSNRIEEQFKSIQDHLVYIDENEEDVMRKVKECRKIFIDNFSFDIQFQKIINNLRKDTIIKELKNYDNLLTI